LFRVPTTGLRPFSQCFATRAFDARLLGPPTRRSRETSEDTRDGKPVIDQVEVPVLQIIMHACHDVVHVYLVLVSHLALEVAGRELRAPQFKQHILFLFQG